jgi:hypothetical protein
LTRECLADAVRSFDDVLVLPDAEDSPASGHEPCFVLSIPLDVSRDLGSPIRAVLLGRLRMLGAAVPKAAIDEDSETTFCEGHVGARWPPIDRNREVDSEA